VGPISQLAGTIYFDANCFIYSVERIEPYRTNLQPIWERARDGHCRIITSELTVMETLVKPLKDGNASLENGFRALLQGSNEVTLIPVALAILENAARLRASHPIKTPDAIHAASGLAAGCTYFITNDAGFRRITTLPVTLLSEIPSAGSGQTP